MKISVLIPTFNRCPLLRMAVASVLNQSFRDFEIIVVDNCSEDNTETMIQNFDDNRIRYIRNQTNIGPINNHNKALDLALGDYIYFFSDDDVMLEDNLLLKSSILDNYPKVGLVHSNINIIDSDGKFVSQHWAYGQKEWELLVNNNLLSGETCYNMLYNGWNFISMPSVLVRRILLQKNKITFNNQLKYLIDWDLWLKCAMHSDFYFINKHLVEYRIHNTNESSLINVEVFLKELITIKFCLLNLYSKSSLDMNYEVKKIVASTINQVAWLKNRDSSQSKNFFKKLIMRIKFR